MTKRGTGLVAATQDGVTQDSVTQEDVTQEDVTQESVTQESVTQESVTHESVTQDAVTQDGGTEDSITQDAVTVHGFRSSFRTWAAERTNYPREICEVALAHTVGDETERAYQRGDLLDKRRRLMEQWSAFCRSKPRSKSGNVLPLRPRWAVKARRGNCPAAPGGDLPGRLTRPA